MQILLFILAIILFIGLVVVHELGHFITAKRGGVDVEEFGIGFPPKAWAKKLKNGTILSLNWLPLGGFVRLKGEYDSDKSKNSFGSSSLRTKTKILLAGVTMNLVVGIFLLTVLALFGMPKLLDKQTVGHEQFTVASDTRIIRQEVRVGQVAEKSPAEDIGLQRNDTILSIAGKNDFQVVKTPEELSSATKKFAGQEVHLTYKRDGELKDGHPTLRSEKQVQDSKKTDTPVGYLGVNNPTQIQLQRSTWSAPIVAVGFTGQLFGLTLQGLGNALSGLASTLAGFITGNTEARKNGAAEASSQVGGPVAIVAILWSSGDLGIIFTLWIIAVLSLTLALMNILPIPALDGGRLAMILYSRLILKRPLTRTAEQRIVGGSMLVLLVLILLISFVDVKRFL